jgi:hypothetical protein
MSDSLSEWWFALQAWWYVLTPGSQAFLRGAAVLVGFLVAGQVVGRIVGRRLRTHGFDALLRPPWLASPGGGRAEPGLFTPSGLASGLVRCTIWGAGLWWLATEHGWADVAQMLQLVAGRVWLLAAVLVAAMCVARFLAGQIIEFLQSPPLSEKLDGWLPRAGGAQPRVGGLATLAGTALYGSAFLLVLLIAADLFGWPLTGAAAAAAWSLLLHAVTAGIAMLIGWLGFRWTQSLAEGEARPTSLEKPAAKPAVQAAQYAGLGILAGATLLAIGLLGTTMPGFIGVVVVLLLGLVLWPLHAYVSDLWAGMLLKGQKVQQVRLDGELSEIGEVGLLTTRLQGHEGQLTRRNKLVLEAHLQGTSKSNSNAEVR